MRTGHQLAIQFHHGIHVAVIQLREQRGHGQPFLPVTRLFVYGNHLFHAIFGQHRHDFGKIDTQPFDSFDSGYAIGRPSASLVDGVL